MLAAAASVALFGLTLRALTALAAALASVAAICAATHLCRRVALLRVREQQLADIVDTAMDGIVTADPRHRIVLFNRAAAAMFRLPAEQALGQPLERLVPERLQAAHRQHLQRFATPGAPVQATPVELVGLRADGEEFPLQASFSRAGGGDHVLFTVLLRDLTAQRASERAQQDAQRARKAQSAAEAASRAKTEFLARMSHELRTPLNAILGYSQLLLAQPEPPLREPQARQARHIVEAGWHVLALVNDLLDVARIEAGVLHVECSAVDLPRLLDESWRLVHEGAERQAVALEAAWRDAPAVPAWADPLRLRQVLVNLLSNAVKYNRPGGRVRVALAHDDATLSLSIEDSGVGMTPEQLQHLFEPFNRLGRQHGGVDGSGIGLALARQLVQAMDGELHVASEAGSGTRVRVVLPRAPR